MVETMTTNPRVLHSDAAPMPAQECVAVPARKRTVRTINIRIDKAVDAALATLQAIHGDRLTLSQIIRDAIIEKATRDAGNKPKTGT